MDQENQEEEVYSRFLMREYGKIIKSFKLKIEYLLSVEMSLMGTQRVASHMTTNSSKVPLFSIGFPRNELMEPLHQRCEERTVEQQQTSF